MNDDSSSQFSPNRRRSLLMFLLEFGISRRTLTNPTTLFGKKNCSSRRRETAKEDAKILQFSKLISLFSNAVNPYRVFRVFLRGFASLISSLLANRDSVVGLNSPARVGAAMSGGRSGSLSRVLTGEG
jgi:hypothetical protein